MYKALLIDFDDTLYDFPYQAVNSFFKTLHEEGIDATQEHFEVYEKFNREFWETYENFPPGTVKPSERFERLADAFSFKYDAEDINEKYLKNMHLFLKPIEHADELVKSLSRHYDIYIITNGLAKAQIPKLEASGLSDYIKDIFISEKIGFSKPHIKYFEYCLERIPADKNEILVIGDSLTSDMAGGINAGLDTCWFNPANKENSLGLPITYTVNSMEGIKKLLIN